MISENGGFVASSSGDRTQLLTPYNRSAAVSRLGGMLCGGDLPQVPLNLPRECLAVIANRHASDAATIRLQTERNAR